MEDSNKQPYKETGELETIQTYMSDMADVVRDKEMSVIKIASAEQKSRERGDYYQKGIETSKSKIFYIIGGIILIALALVGLYFLLQKTKEDNIPPQIINIIKTPISFDTKINLDLSNATNKSDVSDLINPELAKKFAPQSINAIFLKKQINNIEENLLLRDFLSLLKVSAPNSLIRSFSDDYMIGSYSPQNSSIKNSLFIILNINDYNLAYAGMLDWEKTIIDDLFSLFQIDVSGNNSELFEKPFKDIIIKNKDARILYNSDGIDALFYLFADKNTLIITDSQDSIKEIIARLLVQKTKPL